MPQAAPGRMSRQERVRNGRAAKAVAGRDRLPLVRFGAAERNTHERRDFAAQRCARARTGRARDSAPTTSQRLFNGTRTTEVRYELGHARNAYACPCGGAAAAGRVLDGGRTR